MYNMRYTPESRTHAEHADNRFESKMKKMWTGAKSYDVVARKRFFIKYYYEAGVFLTTFFR